eukprot:5856903-Prymnesium_polylepis.2
MPPLRLVHTDAVNNPGCQEDQSSILAPGHRNLIVPKQYFAAAQLFAECAVYVRLATQDEMVGSQPQEKPVPHRSLPLLLLDCLVAVHEPLHRGIEKAVQIARVGRTARRRSLVAGERSDAVAARGAKALR